MNKPARIIFMGTPEFAVESLKKLLDAGYEIPAVVTAQDKPAGRGKQLRPPDVKKFALQTGIDKEDILQPPNLKSPEFIDRLKNYKADLFVVVAFRMLPEAVWAMPPYGTFNLHASLLPQYRGAAPINWAVINGESKTGVTTFYIDKEIDTGKILFQESISIDENDNAGTVHDRLMVLGANLVVKTVEALINHRINAIPQNEFGRETNLKAAPKIHKEDCKINWNDDAVSIHNKIRGLSPYPAAWTEIRINEKVLNLKIFETRKEIVAHNKIPGSILGDGSKYLKVAVKNGYIELKELQLAGKKRLTVEEFLRGVRNTGELGLVV